MSEGAKTAAPEASTSTIPAAPAPATSQPAAAPTVAPAVQPAVASTPPTDPKGKLDSLLKLAHGTPEQQKEYAQRQGEVEDLIRGLDAKQAGQVTSKTEAKQEQLKSTAAETKAADETAKPVEKTPDAKPEQPSAEDINPESIPDEPSGYRLPEPPEGTERSAIDQAMFDAAFEAFHGEDFTQGQVDVAIKALEAATARQQHIAEQKHEAAVKELRAEWGGDYEANVASASAWLKSEFDEAFGGIKHSFVEAVMPDGTKLKSHPGLIRWAAAQAAKGKGAQSGSDALIRPGSSETRAEAVERRIGEIIAFAHTDTRQYERLQPELDRLLAEQARSKRK